MRLRFDVPGSRSERTWKPDARYSEADLRDAVKSMRNTGPHLGDSFDGVCLRASVMLLEGREGSFTVDGITYIVEEDDD